MGEVTKRRLDAVWYTGFGYARPLQLDLRLRAVHSRWAYL